MPEAKPARTLRERALALLARREHSRFELTRKLERAAFSLDEINPLLDQFEEKDWLSDQRFADSYVADHCIKAGSIKLAHELRQRGVKNAMIESALKNSRASESERAREVWLKKFGSHPADPAAKSKQMRFLQGRGFTPEVIFGIVNLTD